MSPVPRNNFTEGYDHGSSFSLHEDDIADQHQEHQSTRSELPAEIPDSQPDPYLPSEIPDSQPETTYHKDLSFEPDYSEVSSQLPSRDHRDLPLGDPNAFALGDYDVREKEAVEPWNSNFHEQKHIDPRVDRFDRFDRGEVDDSAFDQVFDSSSSVDTEIIPGGTRLTERLGNSIPLHKVGIRCNGRLPVEAPQYKDCEEMEETCTQPVTQQVTRKEAYTSMLSEQDESDIICILLPTSPGAHEAVELTANAAPQHILQNHGMSHIYEAPDSDMETTEDTRPGDGSDHDDTQVPNPSQSKWDGIAKDIALRFSSKVHDLGLGFTFGRNPARCDLLLTNNEDLRISNRHFRIFMMHNGSLMVEDTSTNGTFVDDMILRGPKGDCSETNRQSQHTLCNGGTIELPLQRGQGSIRFSVKMPVRSEVGAQKYLQNCYAYIKCVEQAERQNGFLAQAAKDGNAPLIPPIPMHALPQGVRLDTSPHTSLLAAATGANVHGLQWNGGPKYNVVGFVGAGAFASVYKLSSKRDGVVFAVKQLDKAALLRSGGSLADKLYNELNVIKGLRHPNIVKYIDHHEAPQWLFIVMEYVRFGDLASWTRARTPMPEYMSMHVARQILQAIDYLHKRGITHRDLKPDNILMENDCPYLFKLSDFGLSKIVANDGTLLKTFCGTMMYCAPEIYPGYQRVKASMPSKRSRANSKYDHTFPYRPSVDIWGLGAVLYHLLSSEPAFTAKHDPIGEDMLWAVMHKPVNWERLRMVGVSRLGVDFLTLMLVTDPSERAPDDELLDHPWIRVAEGPADAADLVLSDPADRLNAHASQLSIGDEDETTTEGRVGNTTDDPRASKRTRSWVPDLTRNVWGETASMVARNQQQADSSDQLPLDLNGPPPPIQAQTVDQPQAGRLFGEIGESALASSGALGTEGNRALHIHGHGAGSYDISSDGLYDDSRAGSPEGASAANVSNTHADHQQNINPGTTRDAFQHSQRSPGLLHGEGAPSLLGTEALVGQLNMASNGSGASARVDKGKPTTSEVSKDRDSQPVAKRNSQNMLAPNIEGASALPKTTVVERPSGESPSTFDGYSPARLMSVEDLKQKSLSPMAGPGSRGGSYGRGQDGQQSRGADKSNYELPTTAFNSHESSQHFEADDDIMMGDDGDSEDEVLRLEAALAAAKAKKAAKAASRATLGSISGASSRPTSSHADPASPTHQPMAGTMNPDATAHPTPAAITSFIKPPLRFGKLQPTKGSIHKISIYITDRLTTYGRHQDSTFVYPDPKEDRVPKQALDIQMWYPGIEADLEAGKKNWENNPKLEAILRTRASRYVLVNGVKLSKGNQEYLWGKLRTGDIITVIEPSSRATTPREKEYLRYRCEFFIGLSKNVRQAGEKFVVEIEKDKYKIAEARKSRESTAALEASKNNNGEGPSKNKGYGKNREMDDFTANYNTGKS